MKDIDDIFKSIQLKHDILLEPLISTIEKTAQSMSMLSDIVVPKSTLEAINSIGNHHKQLSERIKEITDSLKIELPQIPQIDNLSFVLNRTIEQVAEIAILQQNWSIVDDFEEVTEEVYIINEGVLGNKDITEESFHRLEKALQRIELKADKIETKSAREALWSILTLLSFIFALSGEVRNWLPKKEYATKKEIEVIIKEQFLFYENKLREEKQLRTVNRETKVMLKPKSSTIDRLPQECEVVVIKTHHKWVYISYLDLKNNLPKTGWIMKKYLDKSK